MKLMSLDFPLSSEIMTTVRLVTGGVCALIGFDLDETEDCKVCVTESLLLLLHGGAKHAGLRFEREDGLRVYLEAENCDPEAMTKDGEEISVALLSALVEDLEIRRDSTLARISFGLSKR